MKRKKYANRTISLMMIVFIIFYYIIGDFGMIAKACCDNEDGYSSDKRYVTDVVFNDVVVNQEDNLNYELFISLQIAEGSNVELVMLAQMNKYEQIDIVINNKCIASVIESNFENVKFSLSEYNDITNPDYVVEKGQLFLKLNFEIDNTVYQCFSVINEYDFPQLEYIIKNPSYTYDEKNVINAQIVNDALSNEMLFVKIPENYQKGECDKTNATGNIHNVKYLEYTENGEYIEESINDADIINDTQGAIYTVKDNPQIYEDSRDFVQYNYGCTNSQMPQAFLLVPGCHRRLNKLGPTKTTDSYEERYRYLIADTAEAYGQKISSALAIDVTIKIDRCGKESERTAHFYVKRVCDIFTTASNNEIVVVRYDGNSSANVTSENTLAYKLSAKTTDSLPLITGFNNRIKNTTEVAYPTTKNNLTSIIRSVAGQAVSSISVSSGILIGVYDFSKLVTKTIRDYSYNSSINMFKYGSSIGPLVQAAYVYDKSWYKQGEELQSKIRITNWDTANKNSKITFIFKGIKDGCPYKDSMGLLNEENDDELSFSICLSCYSK